ncbi:MAG: DNA adenine methylase, partial [Candidatus Heimdallarchaeaceae archaeon]
HEPFVGSGAVFFTIEPKKGTINDINEHLINFFKIVRDSPEELIQKTHEYKYEKETFYMLRDRFNEEPITDLERAALFLYFNKTAFNGLWRVNSKGKFNVPFGRYKNPTIVPEDRIRESSKVLQNIDITSTDFAYVLDVSSEGDLCYFDPPYEPVSETAYFTSYTAKGFDMKEQERLSQLCHKLDEKGVYFVLSNSHVKQIVDLYDSNPKFKIEIVQARRAINSNAKKRGPINEILVTNIPESLR